MTLVAPHRYRPTPADRAYEQARREALPLRVHMAQEETVDDAVLAGNEAALRHGSPRWHPDFARYIGREVPNTIAEQRLPARKWMYSDYVVARLRAEVGDRVVDAVLAYEQADAGLEDDAQYMDEADWRARRAYRERVLTEALAPFGFVLRDGERLSRRLLFLARTKYLPRHREARAGAHRTASA